MRVYKEHGMSPFSAFSGCLPLLLPMPVLFALFFVFQNTIEFRGVPFMWLTDISLKDPYYIMPLLMGVSMFVLSWIGMRNTPPNPQTKMMLYMLPVMMTFLLVNFASGTEPVLRGAEPRRASAAVADRERAGQGGSKAEGIVLTGGPEVPARHDSDDTIVAVSHRAWPGRDCA